MSRLIRRGERYRIYPTPSQAGRLSAWYDALRYLWNIAHEQRLMAYGRRCKIDAKYPTAFDQINELAGLRSELPWLDDVPRDVCAQLLIELDKAWQRCFKHISKEPKWKRKHVDTVSLIAPKAFYVTGSKRQGTIVFPKIGEIRAVIHRDPPGKPKSCSLTRDGDAWFASVCYEVEINDPLSRVDNPVAIDRGVANLIADSNGRRILRLGPQADIQPRLSRAQRAAYHMERGSNNQKKARLKVARLYRKSRRQREAVLHRESHHYAKNHGIVIIERLNIRNMTKSASGTIEQPGKNVAQKRGLNRAILDAGWGMFARFLKYKVVPEGGTVIEVGPAYSSQTCAVCCHVASESRRSQSEFECVSCKHRDHADVNAAKVLLSRGTHGGAVCGGLAARERPAKQKLRVARRGTRRVNLDADPAVTSI